MPCAGAILPVSSLAPPYFSTLSHKRHDFRKQVAETKMCILIFSTFISKIFHSKTKFARYCRKCEKSSCKVSVIFCRILMKRKFSRPIFEKSSNIKFHQNPSIGSRVVPCGQTDMTKLIVVFRNFANAPMIGHQIPCSKYRLLEVKAYSSL
jgi:hypothetical protein